MEKLIEKDNKWEVAGVETETIPIIDPGIGGEAIMRSFFFKSAPRPKGERNPTKLEIISSYKKFIENTLWMDGLEPDELHPIQLYVRKDVKKYPQVLAKMIQEKADFVIMLLTHPRKGQSVIETPRKA